jgi:hypothetical protein
VAGVRQDATGDASASTGHAAPGDAFESMDERSGRRGTYRGRGKDGRGRRGGRGGRGDRGDRGEKREPRGLKFEVSFTNKLA